MPRPYMVTYTDDANHTVVEYFSTLRRARRFCAMFPHKSKPVITGPFARKAQAHRLVKDPNLLEV